MVNQMMVSRQEGKKDGFQGQKRVRGMEAKVEDEG
jgi:hypothetical protein